ncbi:DUF2066 domain-containing protein [Hydrogenovibrio halophilus]|uniref:DUF2066 domain-containing protein n=1 Tax=Hydrogenovibrio halophilus TaxID=373391 RepID=UPI0012FE17E0|nr:DUF2066 domain-containing protein [Hydrogenovibrio halophilus]
MAKKFAWLAAASLAAGMSFNAQAQEDTSSSSAEAGTEQSVEDFRQNLFDVSVILRGDDVSPSSITPYLKTALKIELVRLTGDAGFLASDQADTFLQSARSWLRQYRFEAYRQDGVTVGQKLIFTFDDSKLYDAFEQEGLVLWPLEARPSTLVYGSQNRAGELLKLDAGSLQYLPQLDWHNLVAEMALPMTLAESQRLGSESDADALWVYPNFDRSASALVADRLQTGQNDYLLSYQLRQYAERPAELIWQLFDRDGQVVLEQRHQAEDRSPEALSSMFRDMMAALTAFYSRPYRDQAQFIGSVALKVEALASVSQLLKIETALKSLKPVIHDSRLIETNEDKAEFELIYQGTYESLLAYLRGMTSVDMVSNDALSGVIVVRWHRQALDQDLDALESMEAERALPSDTSEGGDSSRPETTEAPSVDEPGQRQSPAMRPFMGESVPTDLDSE